MICIAKWRKAVVTVIATQMSEERTYLMKTSERERERDPHKEWDILGIHSISFAFLLVNQTHDLEVFGATWCRFQAGRKQVR